MTDAEKYQAVLLRHRKTIWRLCSRYAHNDPDRTRELVQEVSVALWEHFGRLRPDANEVAEYIWVSLHTRDTLRNLHAHAGPSFLPLNDNIADTLADCRDLQRQRVDDLLADLNDAERQLMELRLDGYNAHRIGQRLGISSNAVYQRSARIISKLKRINHAD